MSWHDFSSLLPAFWPIVAGILILVAVPRSNGRRHPLPPLLAIIGLIASILAVAAAWPVENESVFSGAVERDNLGLFTSLLASLCGIGSILASVDYLKRYGKNYAEYYVLLLFAVSGMIVMGMSGNLLTLLIGLETMSLALYVLAGFFRESRRSVEAAIKYYLAGSFATGIFLFGMGLIFGASGSLQFDDLGRALLDPDGRSLALIGVGFVFAGFAFKIAAAPFHMWLPDVYEGSPTPVTGFMATGVKIAVFVAIVRIFASIYQFENESLRSALWWFAVLTMSIGNVAALVQGNVKRMLAYSAIAHAGYLLVALVVMRGELNATGVLDFSGSEAARGVLYYLLAYLAANLGAFAVLSFFERDDGAGLSFDDLAGLRERHPFMALALTVFMLSLAGIPGTAGFIGKFLVFRSAIDTGLALDRESFVLLAILGILNSLVALYYYLRVPIQLYVKSLSDEARARLSVPPSLAFGAVVVLAFAGTLWWGFGPDVMGLGVEPALRMISGALEGLR